MKEYQTPSIELIKLSEIDIVTGSSEDFGGDWLDPITLGGDE